LLLLPGTLVAGVFGTLLALNAGIHPRRLVTMAGVLFINLIPVFTFLSFNLGHDVQ
jgi:hypothetical protein|tara:strand:- start:576 stop:743 length:168 start_codon:yes stop_codon:yes gene_type:complete